MKIKRGYYLVITPFFPTPHHFAGPFIYDFVKAVKKTGLYDEVLVYKPKNLFNKEISYEYQGIKVNLFPIFPNPSYIFNGIFNNINSKLLLKTIKKNGHNIENIKIAHGHTSTFGGIAFGLKKKNNKILTLVHHHDPDPYTIRNGKFAGNWLNLFIRTSINIKLFSKIDYHVCISNYVKNNLVNFPQISETEYFDSYKKRLSQISRLLIKTPKFKNIEILYNGVDIEKFKPSIRDNSNETFVIGCIGNFIDWKDQITLLRAINILKEKNLTKKIKVKLIGSGPELQKCKDYVNRNNLSELVEFIKECDHSDLPFFYQSLDLFVLPSFFEGFGCVFTEAAACGVPFICCKNQGASEYLSQEQQMKWSIIPKDYKSIAKIIERQIENPIKQEYRFPFDINQLVSELLFKLKQ